METAFDISVVPPVCQQLRTRFAVEDAVSYTGDPLGIGDPLQQQRQTLGRLPAELQPRQSAHQLGTPFAVRALVDSYRERERQPTCRGEFVALRPGGGHPVVRGDVVVDARCHVAVDG